MNQRILPKAFMNSSKFSLLSNDHLPTRADIFFNFFLLMSLNSNKMQIEGKI
jgi:hypothetical protein